MIDPDAPLRLSEAARIAFPDGSMSVSGLRKERDRLNLVVEKIAGKEYTTLNRIQTMRDLCRVNPKGHDSTCVPSAVLPQGRSKKLRDGSSSIPDTKKALDAARLIVASLNNGSPNT
jgi:hypothetical protein